MQQRVPRDEIERLRLAQAQQDGQREVEAPLRLVQPRERLQQRGRVAAGAARAAGGQPYDRRSHASAEAPHAFSGDVSLAQPQAANTMHPSLPLP